MDFYTSRDQSDPRIGVEDLKDLALLAWNLDRGTSPFYSYLRSVITDRTKEALQNYLTAGGSPSLFEQSVVADLQKLVEGPPLDGIEVFRHAVRKISGKDSANGSAAGTDERMSRNRRIIEESCSEIAGREKSDMRKAINRNAEFAAKFGKKLIPVEINQFPFGYRYNLSRNFTQASVLASVALLLGFEHVFIPAAVSYAQLAPLGSHPLTDPLWSTEGTSIIHDGCEHERSQKLKVVSDNPGVLENLMVCFNDMNRNCGKCTKCLRTMTALRLHKVHAAPFPQQALPDEVRKAGILDDLEMIFFKEHLALAMRSGDKEMERALMESIKRYERRRMISGLDNTFFGGILQMIRQSIRPPGPSFRRIDSAPGPTS
jgi:hypothetical protein